MHFVFFFFQAEDGIRDLVRSRGLGDVYKRQGQDVAGVCRPFRRGDRREGHRRSVAPLPDQPCRSIAHQRTATRCEADLQSARPGKTGQLRLLAQLSTGAGSCLLYTSDAADERSSVDLGGRRLINKKKSHSTCNNIYKQLRTKTIQDAQ